MMMPVTKGTTPAIIARKSDHVICTTDLYNHSCLLSGLLLLFVVVLSEEKKNKEKTPSQFWNLRWELRPMHDVVVSFIIVSC